MPKKTKREKIIAEYRRKLRTTTLNATARVVPETGKQQNEKSSIPEFQLRADVLKQSVMPAATLSEDNLPYIRKDLTKTLALTGIALIIEFLLYWRLK